jgi:U1 small nuclear ribonucleoprotein
LVARLNYKTKEDTLKFEFEKYGLIKSVRIIKDEQGNSRGYGFVEFDSKEDFITAYKKAYGKKIEERRILVDYERGRTVLTWRPRRFG